MKLHNQLGFSEQINHIYSAESSKDSNTNKTNTIYNLTKLNISIFHEIKLRKPANVLK